MSIVAYLKDIGRGRQGARSLGTPQAEDLMRQIFDGRVSDLQLGAFAIAMRIKGESPAELAGFVAAAQAHLAPAIAAAIEGGTRPVVWLPSYNGARKLPNLTPLLAGMLAQQGLAVIVHGRPADPARVTSHDVFRALGWPVVAAASDAAVIGHAWQTGRPVFITTEALCPPLARLLDVRHEVGLRNAGHTVCKLLALRAARPFSALRVVNHTHPEYAVSLAQYLAEARADALLLRGTEGEPVADARRTPRMEAFVAGQRVEALGVPGQGGVLVRVPVLPSAIDAATTAGFIQAILAGAGAAPGPIQTQASAIVALAQASANALEQAA